MIIACASGYTYIALFCDFPANSSRSSLPEQWSHCSRSGLLPVFLRRDDFVLGNNKITLVSWGIGFITYKTVRLCDTICSLVAWLRYSGTPSPAQVFLDCKWRHHFLKSKFKLKPPNVNLLSLSGIMRGGKFIFVNNFSAQEHVSSKNRHI